MMNIFKVISEFTNDDFVKKLSKAYYNNNDLLQALGKSSEDEIVKSIANSYNDNQQKSKDWLIENASNFFSAYEVPNILVAAGWYGLLASKIQEETKFQGTSFDMDPKCQEIGQHLHKNVKFKTANISDFEYTHNYNIIICTSCEHIEQKVLDEWLSKRKKRALVILQSNNYNELTEHINCNRDLKEFEEKCGLKTIHWSGELDLGKFKRFMVVGI